MKPIAVISTDWHIDTENVGLSVNLMTQQIQLAKSMGVNKLICLGDIFESQRSQPEEVLTGLETILNLVQSEGMTLIAIAGNHDKTDRYSWESFLTPFETHPAFKFIKSWEWLDIGVGETCLFLSYVREKMWVEALEDALAYMEGMPGKKYLFSHQAVNGSTNNDGTKVQSSINAGLLSAFEKCFFGHYHNPQQPTPNVFHLGSWKQKNFGENFEKGFYVLGLDENGILDTQLVMSDYPQFITVEMNAKDIDAKAIQGLVDERAKEDYSKFRVAIRGTADELKGIDTAKLADAGIKVKKVDMTLRAKSGCSVSISNLKGRQNLERAFKTFCDEKGYNYGEGVMYLNLIK